MPQTGAFRIARILGIPIYVHYSWFIVFALISWSFSQGFASRYPDLPVSSHWEKGVAAALLLFGSVIFHELGHSVVAIRNGVGIVSITLFIFGGVARLKEEPSRAGVELKIAIAGPIASFLLAGVFFALSAGGANPVASHLSSVNLMLGGFNLIPAFPLDGGRVLRAILWRFTSRLRATQIASGVGTFFAYLLMLYGLLAVFSVGASGLWLILMGWFLKSVSMSAYQQVRLDEMLSDVRVRDLMVSDFRVVPANVSIAEAVSEYFLRYGFGGFPVSDGSAILGILSLSDIRHVPQEDWPQTSVQAVMTRLDERSSIGADRNVLEALTQMAASGIGRLVVVDEGRRSIGLITHSGILRRLQLQEQLQR